MYLQQEFEESVRKKNPIAIEDTANKHRGNSARTEENLRRVKSQLALKLNPVKKSNISSKIVRRISAKEKSSENPIHFHASMQRICRNRSQFAKNLRSKANFR